MHDGEDALSPAIAFAPAGVVFDKPATLLLPYAAEQSSSPDAMLVRIREESGLELTLAGPYVEVLPEQHQVRIALLGFSTVGVLQGGCSHECTNCVENVCYSEDYRCGMQQANCRSYLPAQICEGGTCVEEECTQVPDSCQSPFKCLGGRCRCPAGTTLCGAQCVDLSSDRHHCGSCTASPLKNGQYCCGGAPSWATDNDHCGHTCQPCPAGTECDGGICRPAACSPACDPGYRCVGVDCLPIDGCLSDQDCQGKGECIDGTCTLAFCSPKDCNDGDACTKDECLATGKCTNSEIAGCCNGDTDCPPGNKCSASHTCECVPNGCGGACGATCPSGQTCATATGICTCNEPCAAPKQCGTDGKCACPFGTCGPTCDTCEQPPFICQNDVCLCLSCGDKHCGPGCGRDDGCGRCMSPLVCDEVAGTCGCQPTCAGKACGVNGCGESCGTCPSGTTCDNASGQCLSEYVWVASGTSDCTGNDAYGPVSGSADPDPSLCNSGFLGKTAICWDGDAYKLWGSPTPACVYKNIAAGSCTGGGCPGFRYECTKK